MCSQTNPILTHIPTKMFSTCQPTVQQTRRSHPRQRTLRRRLLKVNSTLDIRKAKPHSYYSRTG